MKKLIGIGDCCIDYYAQTDTAYPGGNPVNVAVYYNRLGGKSAYIGSVGTDRFGKVMTDALKGQNVR
jgi:fructoselysine 6-kinase